MILSYLRCSNYFGSVWRKNMHWRGVWAGMKLNCVTLGLPGIHFGTGKKISQTWIGFCEKWLPSSHAIWIQEIVITCREWPDVPDVPAAPYMLPVVSLQPPYMSCPFNDEVKSHLSLMLMMLFIVFYFTHNIFKHSFALLFRSILTFRQQDSSMLCKLFAGTCC